MSGSAVTGRADRWIRWTTTGCVAMLALIAGTVSYLHMHELVAMHGQPGWVAALTPLSADGMIVAASTTLLAESRSGMRGGVLPWSLLTVGSVASRAAWPSFALICSYELLMRHVRHTATSPGARPARQPARTVGLVGPSSRARQGSGRARGQRNAGVDLQRQAWEWALANRAQDGSLPSGRMIARRYGRHERWGRLVKRAGLAGGFHHDEGGLAA